MQEIREVHSLIQHVGARLPHHPFVHVVVVLGVVDTVFLAKGEPAIHIADSSTVSLPQVVPLRQHRTVSENNVQKRVLLKEIRVVKGVYHPEKR